MFPHATLANPAQLGDDPRLPVYIKAAMTAGATVDARTNLQTGGTFRPWLD